MIRKGICTLARTVEYALEGRASVFPVRKLGRLDGEFRGVSAARVEAELAHDRVVPARTPFTAWLHQQDIVIFIERVQPRIFEFCQAHNIRTVLVPLLDWLPQDARERSKGIERVDAVVTHSAQGESVLRDDGFEQILYFPASHHWDIDESRPLSPAPTFYFNVGVGGTGDRRNVPLVLSTFNELLPRYDNARLLVKLLPKARKYYPQLGKLHPRIEVIEKQLSSRQMIELQRQVDVSLFPSRFEGLGYPLLESLHCGVPVICTDAPPMNEFIEDEVSGLLVRAREEGRFGAQVRWALDRAHFRQQVERLLKPEGRQLFEHLKKNSTRGLAERRKRFRDGWQRLVRRLAPMVVNIGAGEGRHEGMINLHIRLLPEVDVVGNASNLPFRSDSVDELLAKDLIEHFPTKETGRILSEWIRVIKPTGLIRLQTPDLRVLCRGYLRGKLDVEKTVSWLYGEQDHPFNFHRTIFDEERLRRMLFERGIVDTRRLHDTVSSKNIFLEGRKKGGEDDG